MSENITVLITEIKEELDEIYDEDNSMNVLTDPLYIDPSDIEPNTNPEIIFIKKEILDNKSQIETRSKIKIINSTSDIKPVVLENIKKKKPRLKRKDEKLVDVVLTDSHNGVLSKPDVPNQICEICGKIYKNRVTYRRHVVTHGVFICKKFNCRKVFSKEEDYIQHQKDEIENSKNMSREQITCEVCDCLVRKSNYLRHKKRLHSDSPQIEQSTGVHTCKICQSVRPSSQSLRMHIRKAHEGWKPPRKIECEICSKKFISKNRLAIHLNVHNNIKPHMCDQCGCEFRFRPSLKRHMKLHTGERGYFCEACGKGYIQRLNLLYHIYANHAELSDPNYQPPHKPKSIKNPAK